MRALEGHGRECEQTNVQDSKAHRGVAAVNEGNELVSSSVSPQRWGGHRRGVSRDSELERTQEIASGSDARKVLLGSGQKRQLRSSEAGAGSVCLAAWTLEGC